MDFFDICNLYNVKPAAACIQFSLNAPGVNSIAVSTTEIKRIEENMIMAETPIPVEFWEALKTKGLIETYFIENRNSILQNQT